jgi:diguanylate cyclase (GGDEF)-like protein
MSKSLNALIVEDSEDDAQLLVRELHRGGYEPVFARVDTPEAMSSELARRSWDIVFADFTMPRFGAFDALALLHKSGLDLPFIIVSGTIGEDRAVTAMKAGAHDYILKGNLKRLVPAVERELREAKFRRERRRAEKTIRRLAYFDPLTDLPNRIRFREEAQHAVETALRENRPVALLLMDLDHFKDVNDTLGHRYGDYLLQQVGSRLRSALFEPDVVARLGGDEFGILLPQLSGVDDVILVIRKLLGILEAPFMIEEVPVAVEASIGVALAPEHTNDADGLLQRAEVAMYLAKHTGSSYAIYSREHDPHSPRRLALLAELRQAIETEQLFLQYQPKACLKTGGVVGAEALLRWRHPKNGVIPPDDFIWLAENTGLIKPLTHWVLVTALRQYPALAGQLPGKAVRVAVNLSVRSLHDPHLPGQVAELLKEAGVAPGSLELEITESAIMVDPLRAMETLKALNRMGVFLSIDDFGTGFSSMEYIQKLPVTEIKIDKSFVIDMATNDNDAMIVRSIIELGHNLGLKVVAEGVENQTVLQRLTALGCDYAQGFYIGRPSAIEQFKAWS